MCVVITYFLTCFTYERCASRASALCSVYLFAFNVLLSYFVSPIFTILCVSVTYSYTRLTTTTAVRRMKVIRWGRRIRTWKTVTLGGRAATPTQSFTPRTRIRTSAASVDRPLRWTRARRRRVQWSGEYSSTSAVTLTHDFHDHRSAPLLPKTADQQSSRKSFEVHILCLKDVRKYN